MTKNNCRIGLLLALSLALLACPLLAEDKKAMTAPPWGDAGAKITSATRTRATLQVQYKGEFRVNYRDIGSGEDGTDGTTNLGFRRNRLAFMGAWSDKVSLYVQGEFAEPNLAPVDFSGTRFDYNFQLLDAAVRFSFSDAFKVTVGRFKYNLSRENLEECEGALTLDRSLFIRTSYVGTRDDGDRDLGQPVRRPLPVPRRRDGGPTRPRRARSPRPPASATAPADTSRFSSPRTGTATRAPTSGRRRS